MNVQLPTGITPSENLSIKMSLLALPEELILKIFSYFSSSEVLKLSCLCKQIRVLANDKILWKLLCKRELLLVAKNNELTWKAAYKLEWQEQNLWDYIQNNLNDLNPNHNMFINFNAGTQLFDKYAISHDKRALYYILLKKNPFTHLRSIIQGYEGRLLTAKKIELFCKSKKFHFDFSTYYEAYRFPKHTITYYWPTSQNLSPEMRIANYEYICNFFESFESISW